MRNLAKDLNPRTFIFDVDGMMAIGQLLYGSEGNAYKVLGPEDRDTQGRTAGRQPVLTVVPALKTWFERRELTYAASSG
jgi:hypothetical protein